MRPIPRYYSDEINKYSEIERVCLVCHDIEYYFASAYRHTNYGHALAYRMSSAFYENDIFDSFCVEKTFRLLMLLRLLRGCSGGGRNLIEEKVFSILESGLTFCEIPKRKFLLFEEGLPIQLDKENVDAALYLCYLIVKESLEFHKPRDGFSSKRKSAAIDILNLLMYFCDFPKEKLDFLLSKVDSVRNNAIIEESITNLMVAHEL